MHGRENNKPVCRLLTDLYVDYNSRNKQAADVFCMVCGHNIRATGLPLLPGGLRESLVIKVYGIKIYCTTTQDTPNTIYIDFSMCRKAKHPATALLVSR